MPIGAAVHLTERMCRTVGRNKGRIPVLDKEEPAPLQLRNMSLSIPRGQLCAIVGPVGAGKSSLLQGLIREMKRLTGQRKVW